MQNPPAGVRLVMEAVCIMKVTKLFDIIFHLVLVSYFVIFSLRAKNRTESLMPTVNLLKIIGLQPKE
jgi:hypothetical protein